MSVSSSSGNPTPPGGIMIPPDPPVVKVNNWPGLIATIVATTIIIVMMVVLSRDNAKTSDLNGIAKSSEVAGVNATVVAGNKDVKQAVTDSANTTDKKVDD